MPQRRLPARARHRSWPRVLMLMLVPLLSLAVVAAAAWSWWDAHTASPLPVGGAVVFVPSGASFRTVSQRLADAGVVRNAWNLYVWARWNGSDRQIRNGDYLFTRALTPLEVLARLRTGEGAVHSITIPEGSTVRDIAEAFAQAGFGGADQFLCLGRSRGFLKRLALPATGLEGYLYPDTYRFAWSENPAQILSAMVSRFRDEARVLSARRAAAGLTEHEMVSLASIIEKETAVGSERPLVSAVFRNRLRLGMKLQADPTTVYGRARNGAPTAADLESDSPYNTYQRPGLPPGPICSPGRASLDAAIAPAAVDFIFFVARGDGTHVFSRTLEEHNEHVNALRRRQAATP